MRPVLALGRIDIFGTAPAGIYFPGRRTTLLEEWAYVDVELQARSVHISWPYGLRRKSRPVSLSSLTVGPPQPADSALQTTIFPRNGDHPQYVDTPSSGEKSYRLIRACTLRFYSN
jgi:hypothetical protein